jgi:hypothetical protein
MPVCLCATLRMNWVDQCVLKFAAFLMCENDFINDENTHSLWALNREKTGLGCLSSPSSLSRRSSSCRFETKSGFLSRVYGLIQCDTLLV